MLPTRPFGLRRAHEDGLTVETGVSALEGDDGPGGVAEIAGVSVVALVLPSTF
ncbi:hypothetical protein [Actinomadura bangladeshensis]|uniref:hypothetical protein n=1 Tax=Actinomadura bangladeshensis TaxID=453573 RepID=UPI0014052628|nr:hypothetical protein [Actinomadura bangladeshensis]